MSESKKILIFASGYPPHIKGGGEISTKLLANGLSAIGNKVKVLACSDKEGVRIDDDGKTEIHEIFPPNIYWNFGGKRNFAARLIWHLIESLNFSFNKNIHNLIESFRPDVIVTSTIENFGSKIWQAASFYEIPVVHVLRSYYLKCYKGTMFSEGKICKKECSVCSCLTYRRRKDASLVSGVVGVSRFILDKHSSLFLNSKLTYIYNPVVIDQRYRKCIPASGPVFGYLGRIEEEKGIQDLLDGAICVSPEAKIIIAGGGDEKYISFLKNKYFGTNVEFVGWIDPGNIYERINYLLCPSKWDEPFGRVVVEANSYGIPVIASMRGGLTEIVHEGINGFLFDWDDPNSVRDVFCKVKNSDYMYESMSENSLRLSREFSVEVSAKKYSLFIDEVLSR